MNNLRNWRAAVKQGAWVLDPGPEVSAPTKFQRRRLTHAVTLARVYLTGEFETKQIAESLGVTQERVAQIIRLGVAYMRGAGWLRPAAAHPKHDATPS